jgi:hypothetical protein
VRVERQAGLDRVVERPDEDRGRLRERVQVDGHAALADMEPAGHVLFTKVRFGRFHRSGWSTRSGRSVTSKPFWK